MAARADDVRRDERVKADVCTDIEERVTGAQEFLEKAPCLRFESAEIQHLAEPAVTVEIHPHAGRDAADD